MILLATADLVSKRPSVLPLPFLPAPEFVRIDIILEYKGILSLSLVRPQGWKSGGQDGAYSYMYVRMYMAIELRQ